MLRLALLILPQVLALVAVVLYAWANGYHRRFLGMSKRLPGPALVPFIGRVHDLPRQHMWMKFKEWSDIYGPIYQTRMLNHDFVVISDERVANELLGKRAAIYSDRPSVPALKDSKSTDGSGEYLPLMGRNEYWARQRKFAHTILLEASQRSFYGFPAIEAKHLLFDLVQNPEKWSPQLEDFSARVMSRLTWGSPDPSERLKPDAWALLTTMSPAGPLNNMLTPLNWIPHSFNPWKKVEKERHTSQREWFLQLQTDVREQIRRDEAGPSFTQKYLQAGESFGFPNDVEGAYAVGMLAVAGVFTVGGPLHTFVQAMLLFPPWLKSLQEELDTVCGGRMPELADVPRLPLLRAVIKESLRWRPAVPTGVAHEVERDDVYEGYHIPKGARILPLEWYVRPPIELTKQADKIRAFTRDERVYPEPEDFLPQRWLSPKYPTYKEPLTEYPSIRGHSLFGFGRRTCQGQNLTYDMLLLGCGGIAWAFDLKKRRDAQGAEIEIPWNKTNSLLIIKPDPFVFDLKPRSERHRLEVLKNWSLAQEKDPQKRW